VKEFCTKINKYHFRLSKNPSGLSSPVDQTVMQTEMLMAFRGVWIFFFFIGAKMHETNIPGEVSTYAHLPYWEEF